MPNLPLSYLSARGLVRQIQQLAQLLPLALFFEHAGQSSQQFVSKRPHGSTNTHEEVALRPYARQEGLSQIRFPAQLQSPGQPCDDGVALQLPPVLSQLWVICLVVRPV